MTMNASTATVTATATDPRVLFDRALATATGVVEHVRPDQFDDPTPCPDYDVRQVVGHMIEVLERVAAIGREEDPFSVPLAVDGRVGDGWLVPWLDAAAGARAAWSDDASLARHVALPWAQGPGAAALAGFINEVTVHTWDLAIATGQRPAFDDDVLAASFASIRQVLPAVGRRAMFDAMCEQLPAAVRPSSPPFAEAVDVPDEAPLLDRLIAWNGRRP
jgi:uncharacterized protein (TIGR03086 family)